MNEFSAVSAPNANLGKISGNTLVDDPAQGQAHGGVSHEAPSALEEMMMFRGKRPARHQGSENILLGQGLRRVKHLGLLWIFRLQGV